MSTTRQLVATNGQRNVLDGATVGSFVAFNCQGCDEVTVQAEGIQGAGSWSACVISVLVSKGGYSWTDPDLGATTITASGAYVISPTIGSKLIMFRVATANATKLPVLLTAFGVTTS